MDRRSHATGRVVAGHGVASGRAGDPRFPAGTIALQAPLFRARGVSLAALLGAEPFLGTINIDLAPLAPVVIRPEIALDAIAWSDRMPAENFWLFRATLTHAGHAHPALIYMPDPATKPEHFQARGVIEVIAARIDGLCGGDSVALIADNRFIRFA